MSRPRGTTVIEQLGLTEKVLELARSGQSTAEIAAWVSTVRGKPYSPMAVGNWLRPRLQMGDAYSKARKRHPTRKKNGPPKKRAPSNGLRSQSAVASLLARLDAWDKIALDKKEEPSVREAAIQAALEASMEWLKAESDALE